MVNIIKYRKLYTLFAGLMSVSAMAFFFSCNKDFPNTLTDTDGVDSVSAAKMERKVLLVVVNGARGEAVRTASIPNMVGLNDNAIYSWNALTEYNNVGNPIADATGWANILTGATSTEHNVTTNDFAGNNLAAYPTFLSRIKASKPTAKTSAFVSSTALKANLLADASQVQEFTTDASLHTAAMTELGTGTSSLVFVEYNGVAIAGNAYGYETTTAQYMNAISQVDAYVGALVDRLKSRTTYNEENWLVIITSNKGGATSAIPSDLSAYGDSWRNTFTIMYQPKFTPQFVPKPISSRGFSPFKDSALRMYGRPTDATGGTRVVVQNKAGETNQTIFDLEDGALTVEAKVKFNKSASGNYSFNYPPILSKTTARSGSTAGWSIFKQGNGFTAYVANGTTNLQIGTSSTGAITDDLWHTIAMVMYRDGAVFRVEFYKDGDLAISGNYTSATGVTSSAPVTMGFNPEVFTSEYINMQMTDVRIWKSRVLPATINKYDCFDMIPPDHPNYATLVGNWSTVKSRLNTATNRFTDLTGNGREGLIDAANGGTIQWTKFDEISQNLCPTGDDGYYKIVPNNIDISVQVMQWMGINTTTFNLKGRSWITGYINL